MNEKTVTLSADDWLVIDQALQRMPYGQVVELYARINDQFIEQNQHASEVVASPVEDGKK